MDTGSSREHARIYPTGDATAKSEVAAGSGAGEGTGEGAEDSDGSIEDHPFFDGLKEVRERA